MSKDGLREQLSDIKAIRKELALRFSLFGHLRQITQVELMARLHKIGEELKTARASIKLCTDLSAEEECSTHIRELEDERFQLLSELNGENFSQYTL
jgi:hypothetical protein